MLQKGFEKIQEMEGQLWGRVAQVIKNEKKTKLVDMVMVKIIDKTEKTSSDIDRFWDLCQFL